MDKLLEDFEKLNVEVVEQKMEIKKLMQDKIDLLERLVEIYANMSKPFFVYDGPSFDAQGKFDKYSK